MPLKEMMQKRIQRLVKMERNGQNCRDSDTYRPPNPSPEKNARTLRLPPSYLNRPLPPNNPYQLRDDQRTFPIQAALATKEIRKRDPTARVSSFEPVTICNLDQNFYTIVEGRAIKPNHDLIFYKKNIRDIFMNRANRAYLVDGVICTRTAARTEDELFFDADDLYRETKHNFVNFLREDYKTANTAQDKAKALKVTLANKQDELETATFRFVELRSALLAIRVDLATLAKYRKFLNRLAPLWWRDLHDEDYQSEKSMWGSRAFPSVVFPRFDLPDHEESEDEVEIRLDPLLYFESPEDLMQGVFEYMENQCLNYLRSIMHMSPVLKKIVQLRDEYSNRFAEEVRSVTELTAIYEERVDISEEQALELQRQFKEQSRATVRELMCSKETILLECSVEWVHEQLFGDSLGRDEVREMARAIQALYLRLTSDLDLLECSVVHAAEQENFAEEARAMRSAHHARAELVQWSNLTHSLYTAFDPPPPKSRLNSKNKSN